MILYLRYCFTGVLFHITVHVKDQYVTTYDDVILVKPNRICYCLLVVFLCVLFVFGAINTCAFFACFSMYYCPRSTRDVPPHRSMPFEGNKSVTSRTPE